MIKYSKDLIDKYINGDDIDTYNVDELEDDINFMMQVIGISGDSNFYELCSDRVKCDYTFIKYLIFRFKDKLEFICKAADHFIENTKNPLEATEIIVIMCELTKNHHSYNRKYSSAMFTDNNVTRLMVKIYKSIEENIELKKCIGKGFYYIYEEHKGYEFTLRYYAEVMLNDIIHENYNTLENMFHQQFSSKDDIDESKLNSFFVKFVKQYDPVLANYISSNLVVLDFVKSRVKAIKSNWENYNKITEKRKYDRAIRETLDYLESADTIMSADEVLYYTARELGVLDKVVKYDFMPRKVKDSILQDMDIVLFEKTGETFTTNAINTNLNDRVIYNNAKRILYGIIFGDGTYELIETKKDTDGKAEGILLEFKFKKDENKQ